MRRHETSSYVPPSQLEMVAARPPFSFRKQSVSDAYYGKTRSPQLQAVEGPKVLCLKTGRTFVQSNLDNVFWCLRR